MPTKWSILSLGATYHHTGTRTRRHSPKLNIYWKGTLAKESFTANWLIGTWRHTWVLYIYIYPANDTASPYGTYSSFMTFSAIRPPRGVRCFLTYILVIRRLFGGVVLLSRECLLSLASCCINVYQQCSFYSETRLVFQWLMWLHRGRYPRPPPPAPAFSRAYRVCKQH